MTSTTTSQQIPCYANGRPYAPLYSRFSGESKPFGWHSDKAVSLAAGALGWPQFWTIISGRLKERGYSRSTMKVYRHVLRHFRDFGCTNPGQVNRDMARRYIDKLTEQHASWIWTGMTISVLRSVFDKIGGLTIANKLETPKRPDPLPTILSTDEAFRILKAAPTTRDQLLLGLMYGSGLKVGETVNLKWQDIDVAGEIVHVNFARNTQKRDVPLAPQLMPILKLGTEKCPASDYIFQGRRAGTHLSTRMAQLVLRSACETAGINKPVTCMILRHTFAVHCLEQDMNVRAVQEALGHESIDSTMIYTRCILPENTLSPLDLLREHTESAGADPTSATRPDSPPPTSPRITVPQSAIRNPKSLLARLREHIDSAGADITPARPTDSPPPTSPRITVPQSEIRNPKSLALPFRNEATSTLASIAAEFYRLLKTHLAGRFLSSRRTDRAPP